MTLFIYFVFVCLFLFSILDRTLDFALVEMFKFKRNSHQKASDERIIKTIYFTITKIKVHVKANVQHPVQTRKHKSKQRTCRGLSARLW